MRHVELAVDAAGVPGARTYTYSVPAELADLRAGEVVLVPFGRQEAIAIVLGDAERPEAVTVRPVAARVRTDGPLLPSLALALAREISTRYLAPVSLVLRQMLPPGLLERVDRVARLAVPGGTMAADLLTPEMIEALRSAGEGGIRVSDLPAARGAADRSRALRLAAQAGVIELSWRLEPGGAGPRIERLVSLTEEGRDAAAGARPVVPPLGKRQRDALAELAAAVEPRRAVELASRHGAGTLQRLVRRGLASFDLAVRERRPLEDRPEPTRGARPAGRDLSGEQQAAVGEITVAVAERRSVAILLDGVAAAGKTAIYAAAIDAALTAGRSALVLVPEIGLAVPLLDRLRLELGIDVALLHSGLSDGERADEWRRVRDDTARVVVGTRLAILAPLADPGLIVVDEEHDPAYKSDRTPRYQARDMALRLGTLAGCPVLLGSATPDVASVGRARMGLLRHLVLPHRLAGIRATVQVVDMRAELASGNRGVLSSRLEVALRELDTAAGDRAILLLNRRGSASVVLCRDCGYVQVCPECQRPLVFHAVGLLLRCHHCGATAPTAAHCPACESPRIRYVGGGTQRVEREVHVRFPALRVGRLDRDIVERRGAAVRVVDAFTAGELDVLVGTSLVAKGLDVPEVTLVGVVSADVALNLPDERAAERTFQLLSQAIGRAGRGDRPGVAIVQTYQPDHPAIVAAATDDRDRFYDAELAIRERFRSPPFGRLVKLTVAVEDRAAAEAAALEMASELRRRAEAAGSDVAVLGPSAAYIARRAGRWRFQLVLRGSDPVAVLDPLLGPSWSIDVDPDSLL